jgi:hypothetical protein
MTNVEAVNRIFKEINICLIKYSYYGCRYSFASVQITSQDIRLIAQHYKDNGWHTDLEIYVNNDVFDFYVDRFGSTDEVGPCTQ